MKPVDPHILRELGEWAAAGFYEGLDLPFPRAYGLAFRRLYENMPVRILDDRSLVPCEPLPFARTFESHGDWHATALICDFNHNTGLCLHPELAAAKKAEFPQHAAAIDALVADLAPRLRGSLGYTHSNPDIRRLVGEGFLAMERELDAQLDTVQAQGEDGNPEELHLLLSLRDYAAGVRAFHARTLDAVRAAARAASGARQARLALIAGRFERAFLFPSEDFLQGLLAVHFAWMLDGCDSIGRLDQALGPLYEEDLRRGALDPALARELLDEFWRNVERFNGWNLQLGGATPDGRDGCNALTLECLEACRRNRQRRPNVAFRVTRQTPDDVLLRALDVLAAGSGRPALYNDDLYVETLLGMDLGLTPEDAREIGFGGCTETMIAGLSNVGSLEGYLNLAKALELALHDGFDPVERVQAGPHTGRFEDFPTFDAFTAAVRRQIQYMTDAFVAASRADLRRRFREGDPKLYRTLFTRDCVKNRRSFEAGGARYNWAVVSYHGIANLIDSLSAIRTCVFEDRAIAPAQLLRALADDFAGHEPLRHRLQSAPRFGNDDDRADRPGAELLRFAWEQLYANETPRGGRYIASCILFATYGRAGQAVGALPDGRRAFEPLADSVGPTQGRDTRGPTAMLRSVTKLPLALAVGTPVLNIRLQKPLLREDGGRRAVAAMIRSYFAQGGLQIQVSALGREEMLDAQQHPDRHADLIVRIGGYSEYFTRLDRSLQDTVLARTEHGV